MVLALHYRQRNYGFGIFVCKIIIRASVPSSRIGYKYRNADCTRHMSLVVAGCFAWLFFGQKKMAFYSIIAMTVIAAIVNMVMGLGIVSAILGLGLSVLVNWLIFRKSLEFLD